MKKALCRGDAIVLLFTLCVAAGCLVWWFLPRAAGTEAVVTSPAGETRYALAQPAEFTVAGAGGISLTVEISNRRVRVKHSSCPDRLCVHSGWLSQNGQAAVCVPAAVCVRVAGGDSTVDGVTA